MKAPYKKPTAERPQTGVLFFHYQDASSQQWTLTGVANIEGFQYEIEAFEKTSKAGKAYLHLYFKRVQPEDAADHAPAEFKPNWRSFRAKRKGP